LISKTNLRRGLLPILFVTLATGPGLRAANVAFSPGAYIIDMGQMPQTPANGLKPYGLIYSLVMSNQVTVSWAINPNKVTDKNPTATVEGIDFVLNGKPYRGGPFIIPAEDVNPTVTALIAVWRAKGVLVDGPITNSFTAPVYDIVNSFPNVVLDSQNGTKLITSFYLPAEVPASSYRLGKPTDLATCDDVYGMPHADPQTWDAATRAGLLKFILQGGCFWASCHAVSAMEASPPTYVGFNFLSTTSLIPWTSHLNRNTIPFAYNTNQASIWADPLMQFMGKVDQALQGGSEEIYVPDANGWGAHARVAIYDKFYADSRQPWISHSNPSMAAADVVFGRAFNNTNYGEVMYVSSHTFQADGVDQNTAVGRMYGNLLLTTGIHRRPRVILNVTITTLKVGDTTTVNAAIAGNGGPYSIRWSSSDGTFGDPTSTNTTFTATSSPPSGISVIRATVSDPCNVRTFSGEVINILPADGPPLYKTANWTNAPGPAQAGDQIDYQLKMDNYTNQPFLTGAVITDFLPPNTSYKAGSANPPLSSGPDPLVWKLGTNSADIPGVVGGMVTNILNATTNTFDTYINNNSKGLNYGGATNLIVSGDGAHERRTLVRFDLSAIPTNATVTSANLLLTKIGGTALAARNISVHRLTNDWTENTLNGANGAANWNQRKSAVSWAKAGGDFLSAGESTNSVGTGNGPYTWDVTRAITNAIATRNATTTNGFLLRYNIAKLPNDSVIFGSSENAAGNGPALAVVYSSGISTTTRLTTSPYRLIGSHSSLPTVTVTMQVTVNGNSTNLTVTPPGSLTVNGSAGATAAEQGGSPSPASATIAAGGGTVTFTYQYSVTSLGMAPGSLSFSGKPANAGGATYATGVANTILTMPTLNYSVFINAPLPPAVQRIPNTATFSDLANYSGTNAVTSSEADVPINNTNPDLGAAKAVRSIVNLGDGRYVVTFDFAVTNLGSVTVSNVQVGDNLNAAFAGKPLSGLSLTTTPNLTPNLSYDGISNTNLLAGTNILAAGAGGTITLTATIIPGSPLIYANQARASATDVSGTIGTTDLSNNGYDPDPNHDGDPTESGENNPTPVIFSENPAIAVTKSLVSSVKNTNGTFSLVYSILVVNVGDVSLSGVQASDSLSTAFPAPATFTVDSLSSGDFAVNGGYNGNGSSNLLAASQTLAVGAQGTITLGMTVNKNGGATVNFTNQAAAGAVSPASQTVTASAKATAVLEAPAITASKQVTALIPNGTNFIVTMRMDAINAGDVTLKNVQLADDLDDTFSGVQSFTITSRSASGLTLNTNFDGVSDINMLAGTDTLAIGATGSVFLTVSVVPGLGTSFGNRAVATGTSTSPGGQTVTGYSPTVGISPGLVQGTLFIDRNTNGVFDAGDEPIPYVDVVVTTSSNTTFTVASDSLGHFEAFVTPGTTTINVNQLDPEFPTNATLTVGSANPATVIVPAGASATVDTGYVLPAAKGIVSGYVFLDNDDDGLYDVEAGDAPIVNVAVQVVDKNGVTNTVRTDIHGYFLEVVAAGQAMVTVNTADTNFPPGKVLTINDFGNGSNPALVVVPDGGVVADNVGFVTPDAGTGAIVGFVYLDRNTNGVFDVADSPITDVPVAITDTNGVTTVVTSDAGGFYSLIVNAGPVTVNVVTNDPQFPAGAFVTVGTTNPATVTVPDGGTVRHDAGFRLPAGMGLISGVIYVDENNDGLYEPGIDTPITGITLNITDTNGVVRPVTTDLDGFYSLTITNGITIMMVNTSDPNFPANLRLTSNAQGQGSNPATVFVPSGGAVSVNTGFTRVIHKPLAADDTASTLENTPASGNVLLNDDLGDPPISSLTVISAPSHGAAILNLDGSFTYTPAVNFYGVDSFVYQLCDADGDCSTATVTITVIATQADLAVFKSGSGSVTAGSNLTYTVTVTNLGPSMASSVVVTDNLPNGVVFVSATGGGLITGGGVSWNFGDLANGSVTNVTLTVTVPASGTLTNIATVSSSTGDPNPTNNITPPVLTLISSSPLLVTWPTPTNIVYGTALGTNQNNATASVAGTFVYNPTNGTVLPAGTNALHVVFTPTDTNYAATNLSVLLVVTPAPLSITAGNQSKLYGTTLNLGTTNFIASGLVNGDTVTNVTLTSAGAASGAAIGTYPIIASNALGIGLTNYNLSYVNGTLTVNPSTYTASWPTPTNIVYGTALGTNQNNATASVAGTFVYNPTNGTVLPAGTNALHVVFTPTDTNYAATNLSVLLVVTPAPLSITAGNQSKLYGTTLNLGTTNFVASGLVNGDTVANVTLASAGAASGAAVGTYPITASNALGTGLTNYNISYVNGTLTVNPSTYTASWPTPTNIVYGTALGTNQNNATASVAGTFVYNPTNGTVLPAGTNSLHVVFTPTDTNYTATNLTVFLVVTPAPLSITAGSQSKLYGTTLNLGTTNFVASGLVNGDTVTNVTLASAGAASGAAVGSYPITVSNALGTGLTNYNLNYVNGTLTVSTGTYTASWPTPTDIIYGTALGTNQNNATASVPGTFVYNPTNGTVLPAGTNTLHVIFTPTDTNYVATNLSVLLVVTPAPLNITAGNQSKLYGTTLNLGTTNFIAGGLVNGDTVTNVTLTSAGAASGAAVGTYPIIASNALGIGLTNYNISYVNGTLTVSTGTYTASWPTPTNIVYGTALGTNQNRATASVPGSFVYNPTNGSVLPAGTNTLHMVFTPTDTNYAATNLSVFLVVTPAPLSITAGNQSKLYGTTLNLGATNFIASGLVNGDTVTNVTLTSAGAASGAAVGTYPIIASNALGTGLTNYNLSYVNGTLTVTNAAQSGFAIQSGSAIFNPQTGLYEETAVVTNLGPSTVAGVRLYVGGLTNYVTLYNATGTTNGTPYVDYYASLNPGSNVTFILEFYDSKRLPFTNTLTAVAISFTNLPSARTNGVPVTTVFMDTRIAGNTRFVIEFKTVPGKSYTIIYSDDNMATWNVATPSITANATVTQWYDDGPPKTDSKPMVIGNRFYRVIQD
jgi:uncharacterized repeat protein (TIGR01451 family)